MGGEDLGQQKAFYTRGTDDSRTNDRQEKGGKEEGVSEGSEGAGMTMQDDGGREIGGPSKTRQSTVWARHVWSGLQLAYNDQNLSITENS